MSAPEIAPSPEKSSPKRPFWRKKRYWVPAALVALVYCLYCVPARLRVSPETTGAVEPLTADGKCVDYAKLYLDAQDAYLGEPTANGFRELLTAFGPLVLEQKYAASRVPWEKFPTDETTAKWFAGYWTRLCEKYAVDPAAQPTFLRRLDLFEHLKLYGATGEETPDVDPETAGGEFEVWVDCEPRVGKLTSTVANDAYCRLLDAPWTAEEFPAAARWMEENADVFDVYARAVNAARFSTYHFPTDEEFAFITMLLPDVQAMRSIARDLSARANYRLGEGDIDGALADRRLMLKLSRHMLDDPNGCLIQGLVGIAIFSIAANVAPGKNPEFAPTAEQLATAARDLDEIFGDFDFNEAWLAQMAVERDYLMRPTIVEITTNRGALGKGEYLGFERGVGLLRLTPAIDPNVVLRRANEAFEASLAEDFTWEDYEYVKRSPAAFFSPLRSVRSKAFASALINLLLPATEAAREAYRRQRCAFNLCEISLAAARYAAENGAPLPAFSVDADGKPLHSWRVLILPYLELTPEEREFYGQIRLDEPWDSEFNAQFQAKAPAVFRCPSVKLDDPGETTYSVILGENSLFDESGAGRDPREIAKDPERDPFNQILVAERLAPVVWTRPDAELAEDLAFAGVNLQDAADGLGSRHPGGVNYATPAGGAAFISTMIPQFYEDAAFPTDRVSLEGFVKGLRYDPTKYEAADEVSGPDSAPEPAPGEISEPAPEPEEE